MAAGHGDGDQHAGHREQDDRPHVVAQAAEVGDDGGLEEQDGQEDLEDELGVEGDARHLRRGPRAAPTTTRAML